MAKTVKVVDFLKSKLAQKMPTGELPEYYEYSLNKKNLTLKMLKHGLEANMQDNEGAFESWAIALKFYLEDIETVTIDWEDGVVDNLHFNRFVYRAAKFMQTYDWVRLAKKLPEIPTILVCNYPNGDAADKSAHQPGSEGWLECDFVEKHKGKYDIINHQLPVGLFDEVVSRTTYYTTGQKSAIDIWAIKGNEFYVYELKKEDNIPLGIISELMFYTNVMQDLFSHRIQFIDDAKFKKAIKENYRGFGNLYDAYRKGEISQINAIMLAKNLHPLIKKELVNFINDSARFKYCHIVFSTQKP